MEASRIAPRALLLAGLVAATASPAAEYRLVTVAEGLDYPWCVAFVPDGSMLVTEMAGRLRRIGSDGALGAPISGVPPVYRESQGGLFDVLPHPDFAVNHTVYGMGSSYLPIIAIGFAIAFGIAALLTRWLPSWRTALYLVAGFGAVVAAHLILNATFGITPIAAARTLPGLLVQGLAGAPGGYVFARASDVPADE